MFHNVPLGKVIFLGGMSRNKGFCQKMAKELGLRAQLGDPVARVTSVSRTGDHSDLETGQSCCDWATAFGLSLTGR